MKTTQQRWKTRGKKKVESDKNKPKKRKTQKEKKMRKTGKTGGPTPLPFVQWDIWQGIAKIWT